MAEKIRFQSKFSNIELEEEFLVKLRSPDFQSINVLGINSSSVDFLEIVVDDGQSQLAIELLKSLTSPDLDFELIKKETEPHNETEAEISGKQSKWTKKLKEVISVLKN